MLRTRRVHVHVVHLRSHSLLLRKDVVLHSLQLMAVLLLQTADFSRANMDPTLQ